MVENSQNKKLVKQDIGAFHLFRIKAGGTGIFGYNPAQAAHRLAKDGGMRSQADRLFTKTQEID